jgi:tripartite-type tricarboxylate transporter receptor subunit TctC
MALWTEEQRSRWLSARKVLADAIEERGKVKRAAAGSSAWQQVAALEAECSALIDLRHALSMADDDLIDAVLSGEPDLLVRTRRGGPPLRLHAAEREALDA